MAVLTLAERASLVGSLDYKVLRTIYELNSSYEYVPYSIIINKLGLLERELKEVLLKLYNLKLVSKERVLKEIGYRITFTGLDTLAIKKLYASKVLNKLGIIIGEGKESNVYFGYDFSDETIIVKFHRVGRTSYKNIRKIRGIKYKEDWIKLTIENAEREFSALSCLINNYANVPKPLGQAYNAVVMEYIQGNELYRTNLNNPEEVLEEIISNVRIAYQYCGKLVHGDLSEYNILIREDGKPYIIDWPQWKKDDEDLLFRDLTNILYYFNKKYEIYKDIDQVINYIKGE
ncbi:serine/threonine protein kinase [Sulfolobus sp. S-194]|uniref:serine/threonine-protein kinase RIO2 n=1 Tax=Sulfolobus sp. S-194 TaxID=2512240 RepID=UPI00143736E4|nr:RIO1 family regulatory kinase/ATPase [Sulfolobus sp. S-194]QIW23067.1 serine/threonine protein kinase [Sulfolobus sp. S-194]